MEIRPRFGAARRGPFPVDANATASRDIRPVRQSPQASTEASSRLSAFARVIRLDQGLYALTIGPLGAASGSWAGMSTPCLQLTSPPSAELDPVDILTAWDDQGAWLGAEGGTVVARAPPGGGVVVATLYGPPEIAAASLDSFDIRRLDLPPAPSPEAALPVVPSPAIDEAPAARAPKADPREVDIEIVLHVERLGDCSFAGGAWCGNIGQKLQIEAFGIQPLERTDEVELEYMAYGPGGRETRWVSDGKLCGTRGRGIPLTGFAVRLAPQAAARFDVIYQGAFFTTGVTLPIRNGEPCQPPLADDYLEAITIRVVERS